MVDLENIINNLIIEKQRNTEFKLLDSIIDIYNGKYDTYEQYINEYEQKIKDDSYTIDGRLVYPNVYILSKEHFYYLKDKNISIDKNKF